MLGTMTLADMQTKQVRAIAQKQDVAELRNLLLQAASNLNACTWLLKNQTIDVSTATTPTNPSPTVVPLPDNTFYAGPSASSAILAKVGQPISGGSNNGVIVNSVGFKGIYATGNPNEFIGTFEIGFDPNSLVVGLKPLQVRQIIRTVAGDPPNATRIDSCAPNSAAGTTILCSKSVGQTVPVDPNLPAAAAGGYSVTFTAAQCEGILPGPNHIGVLVRTEVCGADESWGVLQPTDPGGPGVHLVWKGSCPPPGSPDDIAVLFVHR